MGKHANTQYNGKCLSRSTLVNTQIHGEGAKHLENTQMVLSLRRGKAWGGGWGWGSTISVVDICQSVTLSEGVLLVPVYRVGV